MIVYKATNTVNGKMYIGQTTTDMPERILGHIKRAKSELGSRSHFHNAINKYGIESFIWEILCECDSVEEMDNMEIQYIAEYNTFIGAGYNLTSGGASNYNIDSTVIKRIKQSHNKRARSKDFVHHFAGKTYEDIYGDRSEEQRRIRSESKIGERNPYYGKIHSEQIREKMRKNRKDTHGGNNPMYGTHQSDETKKKRMDSILNTPPLIRIEHYKNWYRGRFKREAPQSNLNRKMKQFNKEYAEVNQ